LPIWNINGPAEAFLRSLPRFREEFARSCERVIADRDALYESLRDVRGLRVYRPDANFLFCRVESPGQRAPELVRRLFAEHNILVKDCGGKSMAEGDRYLRIASRTPRENQRLTAALSQLVSEEAFAMAGRSDGASG
jgi:histidinol-phosphate/aromatic aminotransferase/cobyric acid decarboxylase-like protein